MYVKKNGSQQLTLLKTFQGWLLMIISESSASYGMQQLYLDKQNRSYMY